MELKTPASSLPRLCIRDTNYQSRCHCPPSPRRLEMYEVFFASLRSPHWLMETLSTVFVDSTDSDILNTDCHSHRTTPSTFAYQRVAYTPCHPAVQRVDNREADRISRSRSASGPSGQLCSFCLCVGIWVWIGFARVRRTCLPLRAPD